MQRSPADTNTDPRDLIEAATPLPWRLVPWNDGYLVKGPQGTRFEHTILVDYSDPEDVSAELTDARLILAAVNNLPALLDVTDALARLLEHFDGPTLMGSCQTCWIPADEPNDRCREHVARRALARLQESRDD